MGLKCNHNEKRELELGSLSEMFHVLEISGWEMSQSPGKKRAGETSNTQGRLCPQAKLHQKLKTGTRVKFNCWYASSNSEIDFNF